MTLVRAHHGLMMGGASPPAGTPQNLIWTETGSGTLSEADRLWSSPAGASNSWYKARCNSPRGNGSWYCEIEVVAAANPGVLFIGLATAGTSTNDGQGGSNNAGDGGRHQYVGDGRRRSAGAYSAYGDTYGAGDRIGIGLVKSGSSNQITCYKNGVSQGLMFSITNASNLEPHVCCYNSSSCALRLVTTALYLPAGHTIWN